MEPGTPITIKEELKKKETPIKIKNSDFNIHEFKNEKVARTGANSATLQATKYQKKTDFNLVTTFKISNLVTFRGLPI